MFNERHQCPLFCGKWTTLKCVFLDFRYNLRKKFKPFTPLRDGSAQLFTSFIQHKYLANSLLQCHLKFITGISLENFDGIPQDRKQLAAYQGAFFFTSYLYKMLIGCLSISLMCSGFSALCLLLDCVNFSYVFWILCFLFTFRLFVNFSYVL